jgi:tetratricopeptide (TPR) repeat protein
MKQAGEDIKAIGKELGVEYVLDASARYQLGSNGSRHVRLTTQLINVTEDKIVWSQTYDTVMTEVFAVQANIAEQVADQMNVVLLDKDREQVWERWTESEEAWDLFQLGRAQVERYSWSVPEGWRLAIEFYQKAIEIDSSFGLAYARMSSAYGRLYAHQFDRTDSIKVTCNWAAEKAMELSDHPFAKYWAMGRYYALCTSDHEKALHYYNLAYEGDKNNPGYLNYAHHRLVDMGRVVEAYNYMKRLMQIEPKSVNHKYDLAMDCFMLRRYEEALPLLEECVKLRPDWSWPYGVQAEIYMSWKGDAEKAKSIVQSGTSFIDDDNPPWLEFLVNLHIAAGDFETARATINSNRLDSLLRRRCNPFKAGLGTSVYG